MRSRPPRPAGGTGIEAAGNRRSLAPAAVIRLRAGCSNQGETMDRKMIIAWIVLFFAWFVGSFVVHGVLLHSDYSQLTNLFRPEAEAQQYFPLMILAHVILSGAFVWIYARGVEAKPWLGQGIRYGVAIVLLTTVPLYLIYYVVQPMPGATVVKQIVFEAILVLILGAIAAFMYRATTVKPG
jgi:hypothetical protein